MEIYTPLVKKIIGLRRSGIPVWELLARFSRSSVVAALGTNAVGRSEGQARRRRRRKS